MPNDIDYGIVAFKDHWEVYKFDWSRKGHVNTYEVRNVKSQWSCSCPVGFKCKHIEMVKESLQPLQTIKKDLF